MSLTRRCDACEVIIGQEQYLEITLRVRVTAGDPKQNVSGQCYGDYCDACVLSGAAVKDLLSSLKYEALASGPRAMGDKELL